MMRAQSEETSSSCQLLSDFSITQNIPEYRMSFLGLLVAITETLKKMLCWVSFRRNQCLSPLLSSLYCLCFSWRHGPCCESSPNHCFDGSSLLRVKAVLHSSAAVFAELFSLNRHTHPAQSRKKPSVHCLHAIFTPHPLVS